MAAQGFIRKWGLVGALLAGALLGPSGLRAQLQPAAGTATLLPAPTAVSLAGPFVLSFRLRGASLADKPDFPELEGFRKAKPTKTTKTLLLPGGGRITEVTVSQPYFPYAEGDYQLPAFDLTVNGQVLHSAGGRVRVGNSPAPPPIAPNAVPPGAAGIGSLDQLLGKAKPRNFYEPPDYASLSLEADQARVYVGQGVHVQLYLYVRPADQALLNFYDFTTQLSDLLRQLRQSRVWEVPAAQPSVLPDTVRRAGGQIYLRFRLVDNTYYPLTTQPLRFPSLALTMIKFRLLKNPQPGDTERLPKYKTYTSPALTVAVRPLPPHPGRPDSSSVAVGDYTLHESLSAAPLRTGEAFAYTFGVEGRGNLAALRAPHPVLRPRWGLELFGPTIQEETLPDGRQRKSFRYRLVPQRPGPVPLDSLFTVLVFNPVATRYDLLQAQLRPLVRGATQAQLSIARPADDAFYGPALARADATLQPLDVYQQVGRYAAWLVGGLLVVTAWGWWRAERRVKS